MGSIKPAKSPGVLQRDNDEMIGFWAFLHLSKRKEKNIIRFGPSVGNEHMLNGFTLLSWIFKNTLLLTSGWMDRSTGTPRPPEFKPYV
jgi:hypothetical protein